MTKPTSTPSPTASYDQPTKQQARTVALTHGVEVLTARREAAAIVPAAYVDRVRAAVLASDTPGDAAAAMACDDDIRSWREFRAGSIGTRDPSELTVAYLAGPEPSNDLLALVRLGLRPENIWAFEVDPQAIADGVENLKRLGLRGVKFVPVRMDEYLAGTPRRFDIIYIDACGALPSKRQKTTRLIVDIFRHGALAPLGVLITNFARPDVSKPDTLDHYAALVSSYLFPKGFAEKDDRMLEGPVCQGFVPQGGEGDDRCFLTEVKEHFESYYGAFITRHLMDIAEIIAPTVRLTATGLHKVLFDADLQAAAARGRRFAKSNEAAFKEPDDGVDEDNVGSNEIDMDGDAISDSNFFSLIWTLAALGFYEIDNNFTAPSKTVKEFARAWKNQLVGSPPGSAAAEDLIAAFYAWRNEKNLWSPAMKAIGSFPYMTVMPFLCDMPTKEVGFYPAFAQLAYPAHPNIRETRRFRYVAEGKSTPMFLDVIPFDECRYVYDWLSGTHLVTGDWLDLSAQLTFRFALDAIVKERRWFGDDFLFGCHVVGESSAFPAADLLPRVDLARPRKA